MKIGIIGNGFVGKATYQLQCKDIEVMAYDIDPNLCIPRGTTLVDLMECDIIFISVPTPMNKDGSCYVNIVKEVVRNLHDYSKYIIVRSTVPVGTCDELGCHFMPEFLTEKNYMDDFINNKDWVFGLAFICASISMAFSVLSVSTPNQGLYILKSAISASL